MSVEHVEVLVEEPSMKAALELLLASMELPSFTVHAHQGKSDLLARLPARLQGYAKWLPKSYRILVVVDRDHDDCLALKASLEEMAKTAGLRTRTSARGSLYSVVNRIAVEELEAWYFGDWKAVREAYPRVPAAIPSVEAYRDPDAVKGGTWEAFERVLQDAGYFEGRLAKIEAARSVARHMDPSRNTSRSFRALRDAVSEMLAS